MISRFSYGKVLSALLIVGAVALCSDAQADMIFIGNADGEVIGRNEADLSVHYELSSMTFGGAEWPVTKLLAVGNDLFIGIGASGLFNVQRRDANSVKDYVDDMATGFPISALGYRSFDDSVLVGDTGPNDSQGNGTFVRLRTDLSQRPPNYVGLPSYGLIDGGNWGMGVTAYESFPDNGDFVVGTAGNGTVSVRQANNLWDFAVSRDASNVVFGDPIVGIGIIDNTKFVVGTKSGMVDIRQRADIRPSLGSANFGKEMTALLMLPGGKVALGFIDGEVAIRDTADLSAVLHGQAIFGSRINALALTSNGNLAIGADTWLYLHKASDPLLSADGAATTAVNFGVPINALASFSIAPPPIPSIDSAKKAAEGADAMVTGATVTAVFRDSIDQVCFAVENTDRSSGIRVISSVPVQPGDIVDITGTASTVSGERVINAAGGSVSIVSSENDIPAPLGMNNNASGGGDYGEQGAVVNAAPADMASGVSSVGLLVKIWGKVTARNNTGGYDGWFYVDDGSGINDGSGNIGIRCRPSGAGTIPDALPAQDSYISVTGVMGVQQIGGVNARYLWTESWE